MNAMRFYVLLARFIVFTCNRSRIETNVFIDELIVVLWPVIGFLLGSLHVDCFASRSWIAIDLH